MIKMKSKKQVMIVNSLSLHFSIFLYAVVLYFLAQQNPDWQMSWKIKEEHLSFVYIFVLFSLINAGMSLFLPRIFKVSSEKNQEFPMPGMESSKSSDLFFDFNQLDNAMQTSTIIRMALAESIAIFGFLTAYLNLTPLLFIPFGIVALVIQLLVGALRKNIFGF